MADNLQAEKPAWRKAISPERDRRQSFVLVTVMLPLLTSLCGLRLYAVWQQATTSEDKKLALASVGVSLTFALVVWLMRSATWLGALSGGVICELLCLADEPGGSLLHSGLPPLSALFVATFVATRLGRRRKAALGLAEPKTGRRASQVIANLGAAALVASAFAGSKFGWHGFLPLSVATAMLCEATADTVSSEIGQAFGGSPFSLLSLREVPAGTDGAISIVGTLAGVFASLVVVLADSWTLHYAIPLGLLAWVAGIAGLFFDSLLGSTLERKGLLGNDLVNFTSTIASGLIYLLGFFAFAKLAVWAFSGIFS